MYWSSNFLAVVFKKLQQVLFHNFHLIVFLVLKTWGATTAEKLKFWNWFSLWHACSLLGYTRPMEPTNESSGNQNAGFSIRVFKNFLGVIPQTSIAGGGDSIPHPPPGRLMAGRGVQAPRCCYPTIGPPQLFSRGCASESTRSFRVPMYIHTYCTHTDYSVVQYTSKTYFEDMHVSFKIVYSR